MVNILDKIDKNELLNALDDDWDYKIFEYILKNKIGEKYNEVRDVINKLPRGLKYWYATWELELEVYNGGFNQYFYNREGEFTEDAIEGYYYFGLENIAKIVEEAVKVAIGEINIVANAKKTGTLKAFADTYKETDLYEFDKLFYGNETYISNSRIDSIKNRPDDFICD